MCLTILAPLPELGLRRDEQDPACPYGKQLGDDEPCFDGLPEPDFVRKVELWVECASLLLDADFGALATSDEGQAWEERKPAAWTKAPPAAIR